MTRRVLSRRPRLGFAALLGSAFVFVASIGVTGQTAELPRPVDVEIRDFAFPAEIQLEAGATVRWANGDPAPHTVTSMDGAFDSGAIEPGTAFELAISDPGVYGYACRIHPSMIGTLTVTPVDTGIDNDPPPASAMRASLASPPGVTVLHRVPVLDTDPLGIGGIALTVVAPEDWNVEGGPVWRHNYSNLATYEGRITSPDRLHGVEFFALYPQIWQEGGIPFFPEGSNYLGNDVRPPIRDVGVFLETLILPTYRGAFSPAVIERAPLPDVATAYLRDSLPGTEAVAERVLTEHFVDGERMLEEFTVVLTFTPNPALPGAVFWTPQQLFSIRAPADQFEAARPVLQAIATSPVPDRDWYVGYQYVLGLSIQNGLDAIRAAGAASRVTSEANAEITDLIASGYQERQLVNDRIYDAMSQTIRGVETYRDPWNGGTLELPNGFDYVYGSVEGNVILTNEPTFDPIQAFPEQTWDSLTTER